MMVDKKDLEETNKRILNFLGEPDSNLYSRYVNEVANRPDLFGDYAIGRVARIHLGQFLMELPAKSLTSEFYEKCALELDVFMKIKKLNKAPEDCLRDFIEPELEYWQDDEFNANGVFTVFKIIFRGLPAEVPDFDILSNCRDKTIDQLLKNLSDEGAAIFLHYAVCARMMRLQAAAGVYLVPKKINFMKRLWGALMKKLRK